MYAHIAWLKVFKFTLKSTQACETGGHSIQRWTLVLGGGRDINVYRDLLYQISKVSDKVENTEINSNNNLVSLKAVCTESGMKSHE